MSSRATSKKGRTKRTKSPSWHHQLVWGKHKEKTKQTTGKNKQTTKKKHGATEKRSFKNSLRPDLRQGACSAGSFYICGHPGNQSKCKSKPSAKTKADSCVPQQATYRKISKGMDYDHKGYVTVHVWGAYPTNTQLLPLTKGRWTMKSVYSHRSYNTEPLWLVLRCSITACAALPSVWVPSPSARRGASAPAR